METFPQQSYFAVHPQQQQQQQQRQKPQTFMRYNSSRPKWKLSDWLVLFAALATLGSVIITTIFVFQNNSNSDKILSLQQDIVTLLSSTTTTTTPAQMVYLQQQQQTPLGIVELPSTNRLFLYRLLDTNGGDGTGVNNAIGDYLSSQEIFYIQPPPNVTYVIARMMIEIEDATPFDSGFYGSAITLTNGIFTRISNDTTTIVDMTNNAPIKTNSHWGLLCYDTSLSNYGSGNNFLHARCTFKKSGQSVILRGNFNERLEVVLNDDFTDLTGHRFQVQGYSIEGTLDE